MIRNYKWMKMSLAAVIAIMIAGCGGSVGSTGSKIENTTSSVEDVLLEGANAAENASSEITVKSPDSDEDDDEVSNASTDNDDLAANIDSAANSDSASATLVPMPDGDNSEPEYETEPDASVDLDLTALSATMVYSEVYQMMYYPENYVGKSVKMEGLYDVYHDDNTGSDYYACIIQDATACCAQGIEFRLTDEYEYPDESVNEVAVKGIFDLYEEDGVTYCTLRDAELLSAS